MSSRFVWPAALHPPRDLWRLVLTLVRDINSGGLDLRATSLVYTSLLAMAPLLAVSFSVLKAFGVHNQMRPFLLQLLEPLGSQAADIADRMIGFVNNLDVAVLGFAGLGLLFYTVLSLLQKIEDAFNHVWRVPTSRGFRERFSDYLSVLLVGPVLVFSALGMMASMTNHHIVRALVALEPFGTLYLWLGKLLPTLFIAAAFAFLYLFVPNTQVRWKNALWAGIVAGLAWRLAGWLFGVFVAGSAQYQAIYSSFAILVVFMIWLYVNWVILLAGADIAFYLQNPRYLGVEPAFRPGHQLFRRIGLAVMGLVADRFRRGEPPWTVGELALRLKLPDRIIAEALAALTQKNLVLMADRERGSYLPARELDAMPLGEVLAALDTAASSNGQLADPVLTEPWVESLERRLQDHQREVVAGISVKRWLETATDGSEPH